MTWVYRYLQLGENRELLCTLPHNYFAGDRSQITSPTYKFELLLLHLSLCLYFDRVSARIRVALDTMLSYSDTHVPSDQNNSVSDIRSVDLIGEAFKVRIWEPVCMVATSLLMRLITSVTPDAIGT